LLQRESAARVQAAAIAETDDDQPRPQRSGSAWSRPAAQYDDSRPETPPHDRLPALRDVKYDRDERTRAPHCGNCGKLLPWVVDANESTFDIEVKAQPTVVLDLWAPWCGPCRFVSPILDELAHQYAGRLKLVKVNVDENQGLARRFDAMSIPTIVVMLDGEVVNRIVGAAPKEQMEAQIAPYLKPPKSASGAANA
jgi:thioredoxin 2